MGTFCRIAGVPALRLFFPLALGLTHLLSACSDQADFDRTYLTEGGNYVIMLQLQSPDGREISGRIVSTEVGEGWKVIAANKPITGTIEGNAVNFTINHPSGNDPATTPVSGIVSGDNLNLTFFAHEKANELVFHRSTAEQYHAAVKATFQSVAEFD